MIHKKYRAVVIKGPKYRLIVKSSRGIDDVTNPFTPQYPVGTRGTIQYQSSASWGLHFFVPYKQDQKKWERDQQKRHENFTKRWRREARGALTKQR